MHRGCIPKRAYSFSSRGKGLTSNLGEGGGRGGISISIWVEDTSPWKEEGAVVDLGFPRQTVNNSYLDLFSTSLKLSSYQLAVGARVLPTKGVTAVIHGCSFMLGPNQRMRSSRL